VTLDLAEKWGTPPWTVEEAATQEWVERYTAYAGEAADQRARQAKKRASKTGAGTRARRG
jgi:hypothetical protein